MAFKSKAQKEHFQARLKSGEISQKQYEMWEKGTIHSKLPDRLGPQKFQSPKNLDELRKLAKAKK